MNFVWQQMHEQPFRNKAFGFLVNGGIFQLFLVIRVGDNLEWTEWPPMPFPKTIEKLSGEDVLCSLLLNSGAALGWSLPVVSPLPDETGKQGTVELLRLIGQGATSHVYEARFTSPDGTVDECVAKVFSARARQFCTDEFEVLQVWRALALPSAVAFCVISCL